MPFKVVLQELMEQVPQAIGAILVDWEGEAVMEECHCDPYDIRFIAAHQGIILSRLKEMQSSALSGAVRDVVVTSSGGHLLIGVIDQDYALVMNIGQSCKMPLALYHFRRAITELKREF